MKIRRELREQNKRYHKAINNIIEKAMLFGTNVDGDGENLQKVCRTMIQDYCNDENGVNKLKEENKRLREALEFYASRNHYLVYYDKLILLDDGEKARKALEVENNELQ